jgi:hypothetical protein
MSNSSGDIDYQLDEARQMWDMDSRSVAPKDIRETIVEAFDTVDTSVQPPSPPITTAQDDIWNNDEGDKDYQIDELFNWSESDAGTQEFKDWLAKDDNSLWYNEDGTRTDYAGEGNPTTTDAQDEADEIYGEQPYDPWVDTSPTTTPPPPTTTPPPPTTTPPTTTAPTPAPLSATMQAFQAARLRKAAAPIDFTPTKAVSGYENGGWGVVRAANTGGTSNG